MVLYVLFFLADMHSSPIFTLGSAGLVPDNGTRSSIVTLAQDCYREIDAQQDVFESHRHHIFSVAYYMTGNEIEAESILQSTFIEAFRLDSRPMVEGLDRSLMRELQCRLSLGPVAPTQQRTGDESIAGNVRRTDLEEALWELPGRERLCFLLRDVEGYTPERIAGLLESSPEEVKQTLIAARLRLRNLLADQQRSAAA